MLSVSMMEMSMRWDLFGWESSLEAPSGGSVHNANMAAGKTCMRAAGDQIDGEEASRFPSYPYTITRDTKQRKLILCWGSQPKRTPWEHIPQFCKCNLHLC